MTTPKDKNQRILAVAVPVTLADAFLAKCKRNDSTISLRLRRLITNDTKTTQKKESTNAL